MHLLELRQREDRLGEIPLDLLPTRQWLGLRARQPAPVAVGADDDAAAAPNLDKARALQQPAGADENHVTRFDGIPDGLRIRVTLPTRAPILVVLLNQSRRQTQDGLSAAAIVAARAVELLAQQI